MSFAFCVCVYVYDLNIMSTSQDYSAETDKNMENPSAKVVATNEYFKWNGMEIASRFFFFFFWLAEDGWFTFH